MSAPGKQRIWEIDAIRGFLILCVIASHTLFFSSYMLGLFRIPPVIEYVMQYGGALFVLLSGLSCTLGSNSLRRGVYVFVAGMILTVGSYIGVLLGWLGEDMVIRFGVLHLLGFAMMLAPILKKLPNWTLAVLGLALVVVGYWLEGQPPLVRTPLLFPLGLRYPGFSSGDYFPIAPHLGWFCLGIVLGRILYPTKRSLWPGPWETSLPIRFFCWCGRNSLYIFVLHLPLVGGIMTAISLLL